MIVKNLLSVIQEIIHNTRGFVFDIDGTIKDGNKLYPNIIQIFTQLQSAKKPYFFLSNSSASTCIEKSQQLSKLGICCTEDMVVTSRDIMNYKIEITNGKKCFVGSNYPNHISIYKFLNNVEPNTQVIIIGPNFKLNISQLQMIFNYIYENNTAEVWAVNGDIVYSSESSQIELCAGSVALFLQQACKQLGIKRIIKCLGKPSISSFKYFINKVNLPIKTINDYYYIGDSYYSDICPAKKIGFKTIYVATGIRTKININKVENYKNKTDIFISSID